jgi:hypothetical protein
MVRVKKSLKYTNQTGVEEPFITYVEKVNGRDDESWKINMERCTVYLKEDGEYKKQGIVYSTEAHDKGIELEFLMS